MTIFILVMIMILTISNVMLWLVFKGLQMMLKDLANSTVELGRAIQKELEMK